LKHYNLLLYYLFSGNYLTMDTNITKDVQLEGGRSRYDDTSNSARTPRVEKEPEEHGHEEEAQTARAKKTKKI